MKILSIIPARGASKRLPQKNTRKFYGKPLIAWSIINAKKSKLINRIIVNTDNREVANIAKRYGAEVPFLRSRELARSTVGIEPVLINTLKWLKENENYKPDAIALLMPTNPLKIFNHLDEAITIFKNKKADSVISVSNITGNNNPNWIIKKNKIGKLVLFNNSNLKKIITRSQDLPICYSRNDIIYVLKPKNLYEKISNLYGNKIELYIMDEFFHSDINTSEDWFIALDKMKRLKLNLT